MTPEGRIQGVLTHGKRGVEYSISHYNGNFFVLTNKDSATNFKLMRATDEKTNMQNLWEEFIPHREDVLLEDVEIFKDYYVLSERENGLNRA